MFEGEYLNKKKWNGKIYDYNGEIIEIKNGNGKVKEYDFSGKLKFEGEYLNGERFNGKEYNYNSKLIFEGGIFKWTKMEWKINRI